MNGKRPVRYNRRFSSQRNYRHNQIPQEPPPEKPSKKLFWTLGIIFIIVIGGVASLFLFFSGDETEESSLSNTDSNTQSSFILCENWSCLIDASENCDLANYTDTSTITLFGLDITTTTYYEIMGEQDNNCILKIRTEEQHVEISDERAQQMLNEGMTQEEIDQQEQGSNIISNLLEGKEGICEFTPSVLESLLENGASGNLSSSDWELAESCEGDYFDLEL